jgi:Xaa-Pro aminopeptidase
MLIHTWLRPSLISGCRKHEHFVGLSFDTISSTGPNAAVIHYKPEKGACSVIDPKAIYLCDSGAQFLDGTTDTTRTLHFGEPTDMERKSYTLVLKGNIALERVKFPKGVSGFALDTLARQFLWAEGLDYRHGTGHGVGSFLVRVQKTYDEFMILTRSFRMSMKVLSELGRECNSLKSHLP